MRMLLKPILGCLDRFTDGRETRTTLHGRGVISRCRWEVQRLVFSSRIVLPDGRDVSNVVHDGLSADGKTLTAEESVRGPDFKHDNVWVLEKE
jgi:hypothetical protein